MPDKVMSTTMFRVYIFKDQKPGKTEGIVYLTDPRHKLTKLLKEEHFDYLDELPGKTKKIVEEGKCSDWKLVEADARLG